MKRAKHIAGGILTATLSCYLGLFLIPAEMGIAIALLGTIAGFETARMPVGGR